MKGFLFLGSIFMWVGIMSIFGGTFFMMTDAGYQCITGFGCDDVYTAAGKFFLAPQIDMANAIDKINDGLVTGDMEPYEVAAYQKQVLASILITILLFVVLTWFFIKSMTTLNATDYLFAGFLALAAIAALQVVVGYLLTGQFSMPFEGFIKLFQTPEVLIGVINYSEVLPLNASLPTNGTV